MSSHSAPTRSLPPQPNLTQLRKQAKELLQAYRAAQGPAVAEVERFEQHPDPATFALADALRVLARAYGFSSWSALKNHVEGVRFSALLAAAEAGDLAAVRRLTAARPSLLKPHLAEFRDSALHRAVLNRNEELTRILMQLGADARVGIWPHRDATSAYVIAVDREYHEIVAAIEQGEEQRRSRFNNLQQPASTIVDDLWQIIARGCTADAIALMDATPTLITACDVNGVTPLHLAAWKHNPELVDWLLDHGAAPDARATCAEPRQREPAPSGATPLDFAAIVAGWTSTGSDSPLPYMENPHVDPTRFQETAQLLREHGAEWTPRAAVALGDRESVLQLQRDGRLVNEIHLFRGGLLACAVRVNRIEMVDLLLDLGLDPDESVTSDDGSRSWGMPLWFASMCGRHDIAELLLARGADVNAIVYASGDPFGMASDEQMQTLLIKHGAHLTVEQLPEGEQGREFAQAILAGTLPASSLNVDNPTLADLAEQMLWATGDAEIVRMCLPHMTRPLDDPGWNYILLYAGEPDKLKLILEHGVDPDVRGGEGYTVLQHLASDYCGAEHRLARANILLDAGASLTVRDSLLKSTPLGWACRWGRLELAKLYLERGADPVEAEAEPWATPLAWATKRGQPEIIELLRSNGAGT